MNGLNSKFAAGVVVALAAELWSLDTNVAGQPPSPASAQPAKPDKQPKDAAARPAQKEAAETKCKFSCTPQEIKDFSQDKLKSVIKSALEYRIERCRNIYYDAETRLGICDFGDKVPSDFTKPLSDVRVQFWAIDNSFRLDLEDRERDGTGATRNIWREAFNADEGISRLYGMKPNGDQKAGTIDRAASRILFSRSTYIYWLNLPDRHQYVGEFFVPKIVANFRNWKVGVLPSGLVELTCNWELFRRDGVLTYTLDPIKGFLPISCYGNWENKDATAGFRQKEVRFAVDESRLVDDVWMPTKLRDSTCTNRKLFSSDQKFNNLGNLYITTVKTVELGRTKKSDLQLSFPEGTRVADRIEGSSFIADEDGNARKVENKQTPAELLKELDAVRKNPDGPEAFEVIARILQKSESDILPELMGLIRKHHASRTDLGKVFPPLIRSKEGNEFVEEMVGKSPVEAVRAQAAYSIGRAAKLRIMYDDLGIGKNEKLGIEKKLTVEERKHLEERAIKYFGLAARYDDAPLGPWGSGKVGPTARGELLGLKNASLLRVGQVAPDIVGESLDGTKFKLSDQRGKITVLVFWASWCAPCMAMVPHEKKLVERMKGKPFALIGVNGDEDKEKAREAAKTNEMTWPSFWGAAKQPDGTIAEAWNISAWPTIYILDGDGVIRYVGHSSSGLLLDQIVDLQLARLEKKK